MQEPKVICLLGTFLYDPSKSRVLKANVVFTIIHGREKPGLKIQNRTKVDHGCCPSPLIGPWMRVGRLGVRDTFMSHGEHRLCCRWVLGDIRVHKRLWEALGADRASRGSFCAGLPRLKTRLPGEWLHLMWESGRAVHPELIGGVGDVRG